jgi:hypothetical protein
VGKIGLAMNKALHWAVLAISLTFLLLPDLRAGAIRLILIGLFFILIVVTVWNDLNKGSLSLTPGEIYQRLKAGTLERTGPIEFLAGVLGGVAVVMAI